MPLKKSGTALMMSIGLFFGGGILTGIGAAKNNIPLIAMGSVLTGGGSISFIVGLAKIIPASKQPPIRVFY